MTDNLSARRDDRPVPAFGSMAWPDPGPRWRIALTYGWRHGRRVHPHRPQRFTDWIQWRKLYDRDPRMSGLADKVAVKAHVAETLGPEWVTPTLWHGSDLPAHAPWAPPFVVKSRHGSNQCAFVRTGREDWGAIRSEARRWMRAPYGALLDEWLYRHIPRGLLVEPFLGEGGELPVDYKIYVFGGRAECVKVDRNREHGHWRAIYDLDWKPVWAPEGWSDPPPPASLDEMIRAAEKLANGFDFVRVDFYEISGRPRFGEMTFYPGSGLSPLPDHLDFWLGSLWTKAHARRAAATPRPSPAVARPSHAPVSAEQSCITHHGELIQGGLRRNGEIRPALVTLPRRDRVATCRLELFEAERLEVVPRCNSKALKAARIALDRFGRPRATGRLTLTSGVETGLGLGSSTADVISAIRACASALGVTPTAEEMAAIAVEAELAVDPLMFEGQALLFAPRSGEVIESWGDWYPDYTVFSCNLAEEGMRIDTLLLSPVYSEEEADRFEEIVVMARTGFRRRDPALIAEAATRSAILNQSRVPLPRFAALESLAREAGALGVQVAHSGVVGGVLLDPEDSELEGKIALLVAGRKHLGGSFDLFRTAAEAGEATAGSRNSRSSTQTN